MWRLTLKPEQVGRGGVYPGARLGPKNGTASSLISLRHRELPRAIESYRELTASSGPPSIPLPLGRRAVGRAAQVGECGWEGRRRRRGLSEQRP